MGRGDGSLHNYLRHQLQPLLQLDYFLPVSKQPSFTASLQVKPGPQGKTFGTAATSFLQVRRP